MKHFFTITILFFFAFSLSANATPILQKKDGAIYVKSATTAEVEELFKQYDYDDFSKSKTRFPRIFLQRLPSDWAQVPDNHDKHRTFIRIMLPLVLKVNEDILEERKKLEKLHELWQKNNKFTEEQKAQFEKFVEKYDVYTPEKGSARIDHLFVLLLPKVDAVPPSIMVASAGIYSDWGTSRLALEANNLYRTEIWYKNEGMKPLDDANASYRYKIFANLAEAVSERAHLLNSHINYDYVRLARKQARKMGVPPYSSQLVAQMLHDSNLKNIAGIIDYTFSYYKLGRTDFMPELRSVK
ncbi:MAG: glucosaminidase domain-containing protein [Alphaproteobacteria bacterium]|nr:glucosaminidase domain-containing protein [Alphaproteobacteria bacterium]